MAATLMRSLRLSVSWYDTMVVRKGRSLLGGGLPDLPPLFALHPNGQETKGQAYGQ